MPGVVRELIDRLTGGRIDLEQAGEPRPQRGWLRGRFRYRLVEALTARRRSCGWRPARPTRRWRG